MSAPLTPADRIADVNDKLVASGRSLTHHEQLVQARRHALWSARWLRLATSVAEPDGDTTLASAAKAIRRGRALIEQAIP